MKWTINPDSPAPTGLCEYVETKEKQKLTEIKNYLHHIPVSVTLIYFLLK